MNKYPLPNDGSASKELWLVAKTDPADPQTWTGKLVAKSALSPPCKERWKPKKKRPHGSESSTVKRHGRDNRRHSLHTCTRRPMARCASGAHIGRSTALGATFVLPRKLWDMSGNEEPDNGSRLPGFQLFQTTTQSLGGRLIICLITAPPRSGGPSPRITGNDVIAAPQSGSL